eukprot:439054-Hanusia_phi.AAC.1
MIPGPGSVGTPGAGVTRRGTSVTPAPGAGAWGSLSHAGKANLGRPGPNPAATPITSQCSRARRCAASPSDDSGDSARLAARRARPPAPG